MPYGLFVGAAVILAIMSWAAPRYVGLFGGILLICAILFAGLRGDSNDYSQYVLMFRTMAGSGLPYPFRLYVGKDPLFGALIVGIQSLGLRVQWLFMVSAIISLVLKVQAFRRVFGSFVTPLFVTLCLSYFLHEYTQIRVAIALGLSFVGLVELCEGNRVRWVVFSILAAGFQISALAILLCELPFAFRFDRNWWLALYAAVGLTGLALAGDLLGAISAITSRAAEYEGDAVVTSHALMVVGFKFLVISALAYLIMNDEREEARLRLFKACYFFECVGVGAFIILAHHAAGFGFRMMEMFDAFSVFILSAALLGRRALPWGFALSYCIGLLVLLGSGGLLLPYRLVEISQL